MTAARQSCGGPPPPGSVASGEEGVSGKVLKFQFSAGVRVENIFPKGRESEKYRSQTAYVLCGSQVAKTDVMT